MRKLIPIFVLFYFISSSQTMQWFNLPSGYETNGGIGTDSLGNVWHAGNFGSKNHIFLSKYSNSGGLLWTDTATCSFGAGVTGIAIDKSGHTYMAIGAGGTGQTICFGKKVYTNNKTAQLYLVKYNPNGLIVWVKVFENVMPKDIYFDNSGNICVAGNIGPDPLPSMIGTFPITDEGYIARFDTSGSCLKAFTTHAQLNSFCTDNTGNYFISDMIYTNGYHYSLKKFDVNGNMVWAKSKGPGRVKADLNGNCFISYSVSDIDKIDQNGNHLLTISHPPNDSLIFLNFYISGSEVYVTGYRGYPTNSYGGQIFTIKYGINGNFIKQDLYNKGYGAHQIITNRCDIFISGSSAGQYPKAFISKIDECTATSLSENLQLSNLNLFPNPTGDILNVSFKSNYEVKNVKLYLKNALGQTIYSTSLQSFNNEFSEVIDLSHHAKGIYFIELVADRVREVRKVVVE